MMKNNENVFGENPGMFMNSWQNMADLLVNSFCAQAVIITQKENGQCKILILSRSKSGEDDNVVETIWRELYRQGVIETQQKCLINKTQTITIQKDSLEFEPVTVTYLGYPIKFPDNRVFGTIGVIDNKENQLILSQEQMLLQVRDILERDLYLNIKQNQLLIREKVLQEKIDRLEKVINETKSGDMKANLKLEKKRFHRKADIEAAFANMTEAMFITNAVGEIVEFNDAWIAFARFKDKTEFIKKTKEYPNIFEVSHLNGEVVPFDHWAVSKALKGETVKNVEYIIRRRDTNEVWIGSYNFSPIRDKSGIIVGSVVVCSDITERKRAEEKIIKLSYCDKLTGLYNRRFYEQELTRLDQECNLPITLVMGDINGLKLINDSFGHVMGDVLLKKTAEIIERGCRPTDTIVRLGGDEFIIILPKTDFLVAEKIVKGIKMLAAAEKVGSFEISISFGYSTKHNKNEEIQKVFKQAEDQMYRNKLSESMKMRRRTIDIIMKILFEKSEQEMLHSKRVSENCGEIGALLNFSEDDINQLKIAGLMRDIGKMGIDEKILEKKQPLNYEEWNEIKRHSEIGYRILSSVNEFSKIAEQVLEHHERWDGKGYPNGLKAEEISLQARIIALSDAYDAMISERIFKKARSEDSAVKELIKERGAQFDPDLVDLFLKKLLKKGDNDE